MKRFAVITLLPLLLFARCGKENIETEIQECDEKTVPVSFELSLNHTRSDFTNLFPDGKINWGNKNKVEYIYIAIPNRYLYYNMDKQYTVRVGGLFELKADVQESTDKLLFEGEIPQNLLWDKRQICLYYFGSNGQGSEGTNVTNIYHVDETGNFKYTEDCMIGKRVYFDKQDGSLENIGNYHVATIYASAVEIKDESGNIMGYDLNTLDKKLENQMSVAMLDLEGETMLGGNATKVKSITVKWANNKEFIMTLDNDAKTNIDVSGNVGSKSLIALLPTDGTATLECGKGRYYFDSGVKKNKVYVGKNGYTFESVMPLEWETP